MKGTIQCSYKHFPIIANINFDYTILKYQETVKNIFFAVKQKKLSHGCYINVNKFVFVFSIVDIGKWKSTNENIKTNEKIC